MDDHELDRRLRAIEKGPAATGWRLSRRGAGAPRRHVGLALRAPVIGLAALACATVPPVPHRVVWYRPGAGQAEQAAAMKRCIERSPIGAEERCQGTEGLYFCAVELAGSPTLNWCMETQGFALVNAPLTPIRACPVDTQGAAVAVEVEVGTGLVVRWHQRLLPESQHAFPGEEWIRERCVVTLPSGEEVAGEWRLRQLP